MTKAGIIKPRSPTMVRHKFSELIHGMIFMHGEYKRRYIRIEDVEDFSKQKWNSVSLSGGVLNYFPKNAIILVTNKVSQRIQANNRRKLKSFPMRRTV